MCGLYMAMPKDYRADMAGMGIYMYRKSQRDGVILPDAPEVDIAYLDRKWQTLLDDPEGATYI